MPNFPGSTNAIPGVFTDIATLSRGTSVPGGIRIAAIMGEGIRQERLVASAAGGGLDGLDPTYASTTGSDGRHFKTSLFPLQSNRSRLLKNGVALSLLEDTVDSNPFDSRYQARIEIATGKVELQGASLVDLGGSYFLAGTNNTGTGTISGLTLLDANAPAETWTARVSSVRRDGLGNPIDGYARFVVSGSVSGTILDGYGNQIVWQSNGDTFSNTILSFAITEGGTAFVEGDTFTIRVGGGPLLAGDSLTINYISTLELNDPEFFESQDRLVQKHGAASNTNRLSLGAQLAFDNGAPGVMAVQAAPPVPRRQSFVVQESASGNAAEEDLQFALPFDVTPDVDSNINFFITDPVTGVETQVIPNKVAFFDPTITASPTTFHFGAGYVFSYTAILDDSVEKAATDGVITPVTGTTGTLSSSAIQFNIDDLSGTRSVKIFNATNSTNNGTFTIASISNGVATLNNPAGFVSESAIDFQVLDSALSSARILITDDLALTLGQSLRVTVVDTRDASFFDAGWSSAYDALERVEVDMVVPLPSQTMSAIFAVGKAHVRTMSNIKNKRERVLMIGGIRGLAPENVYAETIGAFEFAAVEDIGVLEGIQGDDIAEILAGNIEDQTNYSVPSAYGDSFRVFYFFPDEVVVQAGADRIFVDGFFQAAAAAGFYSGVVNVNVPLTNKTLAGFTILRNKLYSPLTLENLSASGICVLQPVAGGGRVIWSKTTTISGFPEEEEQSVVFIRDRIAKTMRTAFQGFVGIAETPTMALTLFERADAIMRSFVTQRLITQYEDLEVKRDDVDPRQYNVKVNVQPVYPVNWIYIRVNVGVVS